MMVPTAPGAHKAPRMDTLRMYPAMELPFIEMDALKSVRLIDKIKGHDYCHVLG